MIAAIGWVDLRIDLQIGDDLSMTVFYVIPTGLGSGTYFVRIRAKNACSVTGPDSNEVIVFVP